MIRFANVATPLAAATVTLPDSVPPTGLLPIATVTLPLNPVAMLPWASSAATRTAGAIALPAVAGPGSTVNASWTAAPGATVNGVLVVVSVPTPACSVYPEPTLSTLRLENLATPATAATVVVPERVPAGFAPSTIATLP